MDDYNGPDDYDGYLHDNEKEVIVDEEDQMYYEAMQEWLYLTYY